MIEDYGSKDESIKSTKDSIREEYNNIQKQIDYLNNELELLLNQLMPILGPEYIAPVDPIEKMKDDRERSDLFERTASVSAQLHKITKLLETIRARIEL